MFITVKILINFSEDFEEDELELIKGSGCNFESNQCECDIFIPEIAFYYSQFYDDKHTTVVIFKNRDSIRVQMDINDFRNLIKKHKYGIFKTGN